MKLNTIDSKIEILTLEGKPIRILHHHLSLILIETIVMVHKTAFHTAKCQRT